MGCTLIHREVLEALQAEWQDKDAWVWFGHDLVKGKDGKLERAGEDVTMCVRARALGYKTWGLTDVRLAHHKIRPQYQSAIALDLAERLLDGIEESAKPT